MILCLLPRTIVAMSLLLQAAGRAATAAVGRRAFTNASRLKVQTFNKISPVGLGKFDAEKYDVRADHGSAAQAIILRSHQLKPEDVPAPVRCIARCGAGTNNCLVSKSLRTTVAVSRVFVVDDAPQNEKLAVEMAA